MTSSMLGGVTIYLSTHVDPTLEETCSRTALYCSAASLFQCCLLVNVWRCLISDQLIEPFVHQGCLQQAVTCMLYRIGFYLWGHLRKLTCQENLQIWDEFVKCIMDSAAVVWNRHERTWKACSILTFERPSWHLNFSACFMKNVLVGQKKRRFWNKWNFVENEMRDCAACHKVHQISSLLKYIKWVSGVFFCTQTQVV